MHKNRLLILIFILSGCNISENDISSFSNLNLAKIQTEEKIILLDDICEEIKLIPLETSENILIQYINNINLYEDFLIVSHDYQHSLFDTEGNFIRKIGSVGNGPGEYSQFLKEIFLINEHLYIYSPFPSQILQYTTDGKFIQSYKLPCLFQSIERWDENTFIGIPRARENIRLYFFDTQGNICDSIKTYDGKRFMNMETGDNLYIRTNTIRYKEYFNDTIYTITPEHNLTPLYKMGIGKFLPDYQTFKNAYDDPNNTIRIINSLKLIETTFLFENTHYQMIRHWNSRFCIFLWDKKEDRINRVKLYYNEQMAQAFHLEEASVWIDGIEYLTSDGKPQFCPRYVSSDGKKLMCIEESANQDENPVLVVATIKE